MENVVETELRTDSKWMASNTWPSGESLRNTLLEFAFGLPGIYSCALPQQLRSQNATLRYDLL